MTKSLQALLAGKLPEQVVYLAPSLRTEPMPQDVSAKDEDQLDRIAAADPLGFLVALVSGHPVISFTVRSAEEAKPNAKRGRGRPKKDPATARIKIGEQYGLEIFAECRSPTISDRMGAARFLSRVSRPGEQSEEQSEEDEFLALCDKRAAQAAQSKNEEEHRNEMTTTAEGMDR